jgi:2-polyprenyl-3-methyl-5-hydroxy-6-metoxy-1,4-benzoquinol methylase
MKSGECFLCGSNKYSTLDTQDFNDEYLALIDNKYNSVQRKIVKCVDCDLIYRDPQLDGEDLKVLYEKFRDYSVRNESADQYFERITSLSKAESENEAKIDWMKINCKLEGEGAILDIGCGGGVFLHTFGTHYPNWRLHGVEPTVFFAEMAKRRVSKNIVAGQYKSNEFGIKFDLISINQVLEHVEEPIQFLQSVKKDLKEGGQLYIEVPSISDFENLPREHDRFLMQHLWIFSKKTFTETLTKVFKGTISVEEVRTIRGRKNLVAVASAY